MYKNAQCHRFTGRKPSLKQLVAKARQFALDGSDFIDFQWGENWITLALDEQWGWSGNGWLKDIDAAIVARDLNNDSQICFARQFGNPIHFLNKHFTVISIK